MDGPSLPADWAETHPGWVTIPATVTAPPIDPPHWFVRTAG
jgi:hypothetical protein